MPLDIEGDRGSVARVAAHDEELATSAVLALYLSPCCECCERARILRQSQSLGRPKLAGVWPYKPRRVDASTRVFEGDKAGLQRRRHSSARSPRKWRGIAKREEGSPRRKGDGRKV